MEQQQYKEKTDNKVTKTSNSPKKYSMTGYFKCRYHLTLFKMSLLGNSSRMEDLKVPFFLPPSENLFQISDKAEKHRFVSPKEDQKNL